MSIKLKLQSKQMQSLVLTPQMRQAIHILQLNNLELNEFLAEQVNENPFLEIQDAQGFDTALDASNSDNNDTGNAADSTDSVAGDFLDNSFKSGNLPETHITDSFYENLWDSDARQDLQNRHVDQGEASSYGDDNINPGLVIEQSVSSVLSFADFVQQQIFDKMLESPLKEDCLTLLGWLDDEAYLLEKAEELETRLEISLDRVQAAQNELRSLMPVGVAASSLADRLSMQLHHEGLWHPDFEVILDNLDLLGRGEVNLLAKKCKIRPRILLDRVETIRQLNPKITSSFKFQATQDRQPDILVFENDVADEEYGNWRIELNDNTLPKILVLDRYWEELAAKKMPSKDREYLNACYNSGNWLVKSMNQRAITLLRVAREIVKQQPEFLKKGLDYLKPMTLRDIAVELDLHESTVSRVTANKLMETPRGIFELKYFFSVGISAKEGDQSHSARAVKERIKNLVAGETKNQKDGRPKIFSDEALALALQEDGINIARRTVAKYREAIGIPSSADRKRAARLLS
ncbi:ABC transporter permease protein [Candidatus Micropelagos thuwalensis]|uniref:RNA polymerase sigma-54 factor n=1 Tax=Candidatus Micropelagius thuwalensis TaxID=1397666 RepID=U2XRG5_9PROT|nr:RNA polymerase factor sigma-54 [Candidatus Micropelagos thuwalensis]ERL47702.1 ABC transporter permease protein [Candidatus Micropelagos thuwalensis]